MNKVRTWLLLAILPACSLFSEDAPDIEFAPVRFAGGLELGQIVNGHFYDRANPERIDIKGQFIPKLGAGMIQKATVNKNFVIEIGLGGLFWYSYAGGFQDWWTVPTKFGPGISVAHGIYTFGDASTSATNIEFGFFPVKYNRYAMNLGEYLLRVRPYPGSLITGSWTTINTAAYMGHGARFRFENMNGMLKHEIGLYFERDFYPFNSLTPVYMTSINSDKFELGLGVAFHHLIPVRPSLVEGSFKSRKSGLADAGSIVKYEYFPRSGFYTFEDTTILHEGGGAYENTEAVLFNMQDETGQNPLAEGDTLMVNIADRNVFAYASDLTDIEEAGYEPIDKYKTVTPITAQGINVTLHAGYNITEHFSVFLETGIIGVQDQPFFFDDIARRIPIMAGLNIPTFNFLDILSLQVEYYGSRNVNTVYGLQEDKASIPIHYSTGWSDLSVDAGYDTEKDDVRWSVYSKKTLVPGLSLFVQIASDHMRLKNEFAGDAAEPLVSKPQHWYYMTKLEFGI